MTKNTTYTFSFPRSGQEPLRLSDWKGKVILIVNTASHCGFTPQYEGLARLYQDFHDQGLEILAVPSQDFAGQEFSNNTEIQTFCERFLLPFPVVDWQHVKLGRGAQGENVHPFYRWAPTQFGFLGKPRWNFHKYLINRDGQLVDFFFPFTSPDHIRLRKKIQLCLREQSKS
jgi:glutathione peroxidase